MERQPQSFRLREDRQLTGMSGCKETDGSVCRESKFHRPAILSNDNDPCVRSDMNGLFGHRD